jgi:D-serine deaminase-like pyridoxal phosphate-dependent protein
MDAAYRIDNVSEIYTPALVFYKDLIERNVQQAVSLVGDPKRLRPHVKTHKTREITRLALAAGITKHKCATIAEAEMLASCGVSEVFLAYTVVGPNCARIGRLLVEYPNCSFAVACDHPAAARELSATLSKAGLHVEVLLDLDVGMHRTGIEPGPGAVTLYELIEQLPGLEPGGFHVYDGQNNQETFEERSAAVKRLLDPVLELRGKLESKGLPVPRVITGGTPTFPVWARMSLPGLECSPGTCFLHDFNYGSRYGDIGQFTPAALLLTRVVSRPTKDRVTFDLGYKAVASDPPAGKRLKLLDVASYEPVLQNEEHFTISTPEAERFSPGDVAFAVPAHVCPTCAMHREALVVEDGRVTERWEIAARDRVLSV